MGRPKKIGLEYFPIDTCFFSNKKIKALRRDRGSIGIAVYLNILCRVYANGYYFEFLGFKELCADIAEDLVGDREQIRHIASKVAETLHYMLDQGLIDRSLFEVNVISSTSMQEQYISCATAAKRKTELGVYSLLDKKEVDAGDRTQKSGVSSEEMGVSSEESAQSKSKSKSYSSLSLSAQEKKAFGKHKNIYLTDEEHSTLLSSIPVEYIDRFSEKLNNNGYRYDSHYAAILEWWDTDKSKYTKKPSANKTVKKAGGTPLAPSWDTDDFFEAAVKRAYSEINIQETL